MGRRRGRVVGAVAVAAAAAAAAALGAVGPAGAQRTSYADSAFEDLMDEQSSGEGGSRGIGWRNRAESGGWGSGARQRTGGDRDVIRDEEDDYDYDYDYEDEDEGLPPPPPPPPPPPSFVCVDDESCKFAAEIFKGPAGLEELCVAEIGSQNCPILCVDPRCYNTSADGNLTLPESGSVFDEVLIDEVFVEEGIPPSEDSPNKDGLATELFDPLVSEQPPPHDLAAEPAQFLGAVTLSFGYCHLGAPASGLNVVCSKLGDAATFRSARLEVADCGAPVYEGTLVFDEPDLRPVSAPSVDPATPTYACTARAEGDLGVSEPSNTVYLEPSRAPWPTPPERPACPTSLGVTPPAPQQVRPMNPPASDAVALEWAYCGLKAGLWATYFDISCSALNTEGVFLDEAAREGLLLGGSLLPVEKKEVRENAGCFQRVGRATVSGLIPGVTYVCRVAAVGPLGPSEFSEPAFPTVGWGGPKDSWTAEKAESFCSTQYSAALGLNIGRGGL